MTKEKKNKYTVYLHAKVYKKAQTVAVKRNTNFTKLAENAIIKDIETKTK